ncbi:hypothetical protein [Chromobacterium phragmitis]|uniref:hypothetical protein n=1 Tax=Chromobacterium phragmitis TaxID=2202141 RepID=UPI003D36B330
MQPRPVQYQESGSTERLQLHAVRPRLHRRRDQPGRQKALRRQRRRVRPHPGHRPQAARHGETEELVRLTAGHHNLLRMWAEL